MVSCTWQIVYNRFIRGYRYSQMTPAISIVRFCISNRKKSLKYHWCFFLLTARILDWLLRFTKTCLKPALLEQFLILRWLWNDGGNRNWRRECRSFGAQMGGRIQVQTGLFCSIYKCRKELELFLIPVHDAFLT
jgi:hypothetical protein